MKNLMLKLAKEEDGATMVEYILLVALVGLVAAAGFSILGNGVKTNTTAIGNEVAGATVPTIP